MKKRLIAVFLAWVMLLGIVGCTGQTANNGTDKVALTMYLWDKSVSKELTPWLEQQFPDIEFTFVVGYNTMVYYTDMAERGVLPDIITCRRFSLNDAARLSDRLMDLSRTEVVGSFYESYIENNRESGGAIRWLPMRAEVDGYVANLEVFEKYGIPVPTNYAEFAEVCRRFEELGLSGYMNDYHEDYSCMEALQGCAIPQLMTMEGTLWRMQYESETEDGQVGLDDTVWPAVFERFEQYLRDTRVTPEDADMEFDTVKDAFLEGKVAIARGTGSDCAVLQQEYGLNTVMLPYFGETSEDNWLLTYPACQVAVNKEVEQDKRKTDAVMQVLSAMFSEDGQRKAETGNAVLSYNKNVNIKFNDAFVRVEDCVESNHLYIRLASTEMFSISQAVVQKMIRGEYGAQEAYEDFNNRITAEQDVVTRTVVTTQNTGYDYALGEHGSPAASSVVNTLLKQLGGDVAVGYSNLITAPVLAGTYTEQQLNWLMDNRVMIRRGELTGAELMRLMDWLVNVKEDGANPIRHKNLIPVTGGMAYTVTENSDGTYTLGEVTVDGEPLDETAVYSVLMLGDNNYLEAAVFCNCPMPEELNNKMETEDTKPAVFLNAALAGGKQLEAPTEYVTIRY